MIETVALVLVVFALCGLLGWLDWNNRKERSKLVNALMSRTPEQLRDLEFVEKVNPAHLKPKPEVQDIQPLSQLSDEDFAEAVGAAN